MIAAEKLHRAGRTYFRVIPFLGLAVIGWALLDLYLVPPSPAWLALAALTVLTGSFTVKIPGLVARLSVSEPFVFAATLWFGPSVGAVTAALDALIMSLWLQPDLKTLQRVAFNVSVLVISIWLSALGFFSLAGIDPRAPVYNSLADFILPLYAFTACSFLLNSGLIAFAISFERRQSAFKVWREQFLWLSLNYFGGASVAAVLVVYAKEMDWAVVGIIVPLLAISYLTFRTSLGRLDDANEHLRVLNRLYLSTIETLAMAVDAKDQVTHGHIRRVQRSAVSLAHALGLRDEKQIRAIEAAALLHDMGKLAIPEYILNKPGRLTPLEFDKMKLHAGIGADILSSIEFPYPVIPIVRHHHESWDGTGYPDGLKGTSIPLGARILSVVDCFDALTSDRPYRPKLTPEAALQIVVARRGTMYDPIVVDTFARDLGRIEETVRDLGLESPAWKQIAELNNPDALLALQTTQIKSDAVPGIGIPDDWRPSFAGRIETGDLAAASLGLLAGAVPAAGCSISIVNKDGASLVTASVAGLVPTDYIGTHTDFGRRICGWVAANKISALNSPATLDLDRDSGTAGMVSSLVCPLTRQGNIVGVLAVYCVELDGFSSKHQAYIERFAQTLAPTVESLSPTIQLPHEAAIGLDQVLSQAERSLTWWPVGVVVTRFDPGADSVRAEERVGATLRAVVRADDSLLRIDRGAFLLLLLRSNDEATQEVATRIEEELVVLGLGSVVQWASVGRESSAESGPYSSLASAIRQTARGVDERARRTTH